MPSITADRTSDEPLTQKMLTLWQIYMVEQANSPTTIRSYMSAARALIEYNQTDREQNWINRYFNSRRSTLSAASLQVHRAAARHLFKFLGRESPLDAYRMPPVTPKGAHPLPNGMEDVYRLLAVEKGNLNRYLTIAFCGLIGMRISEALACKPSDFDFQRKQICIKGKGEKIRYVPISDKVAELVIPYIAEKFCDSPEDPFITLVETAARQGVASAGIKAGISRMISSHDLRMTFATFIYEQTKDIRLVQELLGHSSIETTQIYVGLNPNATRAAVNTAFATESE